MIHCVEYLHVKLSGLFIHTKLELLSVRGIKYLIWNYHIKL